MSITYPTSLDTFSNPTSTDLMENASAGLDHDVQHSNANDAIEALEAKVGANGSVVTTSHDYKLSGVTGSDKAVSKTGAETLTNKTLTAPVINVGSDATGDMYYRNGSGVLTRLPIGASGTIISSTGTAPEFIANPGASDASTTVKGVVELATYADVIARTTTGGTGAKLVPTPDVLTTVQTYDYQADSVGTDSYAITCSPAPTAYTTGMRFTFKAGTANTGACSLNVNGLGAKTIKKNYNSDLATGDILANQIIEVVYDGTNMQLVSATSQAVQFKNGVTTRDLSLADATQTIAHGLGVTPKYIRITTVFNAANQTITSGVYNGTTNSSTYLTSTATGAAATAGSSNTAVAVITTLFASTNSSSAVASFDSTNISLAWTKANSPSGTASIMWEAYA